MNSVKKIIGLCILLMCMMVAGGTLWFCLFGFSKTPDTSGGILVYKTEAGRQL